MTTQTEALKHLREVHALQGRDGCWDIDDYMLGLYNGLELALSIVENRECRYKQRPKSQPEQEPVAWMWDVNNGAGYSTRGIGFYQTDIPFAKHTPLYTTPPHRKPLTPEQLNHMAELFVIPPHHVEMVVRTVEAAHNIKE